MKEAFIFDTGAKSTIIALRNLIEFGIKPQFRQNVLKTLEAEQITYVDFTPIVKSKYEKAIGYLCYLPNVIIGFHAGAGIILDKFYFYLMPNANASLLGSDFIRYCSIAKQDNDSISFQIADDNAYKKQYESPHIKAYNISLILAS